MLCPVRTLSRAGPSPHAATMRMTLLALVLAGCSTASSAVPTVPSGGTRVYEGSVYGPEGTPMFRYTRDSRTGGRAWTSIHRSVRADDGEPVVVQAAEHDASYALHRYVEDHQQLGVRSEVVVLDGGTVIFESHERGRVRRRSEPLRAPVVTGPTLFGFVSTRWDRLRRGEVIEVRFVVAERRRSYAFTLTMAPSQSDRTVVTMRASSPFVRRSVPPMRMTFATGTRTIVRYEGRIPPRWKGRQVDARVEYEHVSPYR